VQPADRALLRLRPLRHYSAGELVAVKRSHQQAATLMPAAAGASSIAAEAAAAAAAAVAGTGEAEANQGLCYGRVAVDAAPGAGQAAYRLSVEVQPGVYENLLSTQVRSVECGKCCCCTAAVLPLESWMVLRAPPGCAGGQL
jgi:hypothetical protein